MDPVELLLLSLGGLAVLLWLLAPLIVRFTFRHENFSCLLLRGLLLLQLSHFQQLLRLQLSYGLVSFSRNNRTGLLFLLPHLSLYRSCEFLWKMVLCINSAIQQAAHDIQTTYTYGYTIFHTLSFLFFLTLKISRTIPHLLCIVYVRNRHMI